MGFTVGYFTPITGITGDSRPTLQGPLETCAILKEQSWWQCLVPKDLALETPNLTETPFGAESMSRTKKKHTGRWARVVRVLKQESF